MEFGLDEDQVMLQKYARDFLSNECPSTFVRSMMESETAHDPSFYRRMADLGWMGIAQDTTYVDAAVLAEEMGRALVPGPFFATVALAGPAIMEAGTGEQQGELLPGIASGDRIATVAYTEASGRVDASGIDKLTAEPEGNGFVLSGTKMFVPDAHVADTLVVAARTTVGHDPAKGVTLFAVDANAPGIAVSQLPTMDTTRRWCEVAFDDVKVGPGAVMGTVGAGWPTLERALQKSAALLSAECVGGAQKILDVSVDYAKERMQFGRPIGSFQAVKHRCADMLVDVEMARSAMYYAAWAASENDPELPLAASIAKSYCSSAFMRVASNGIMVHGGIGFTWEHDLHMYFKRAKSNELLLGDPTYHKELVARLIAA